MSKTIFDERQVSVANKFGLHAFLIIFHEVIINAVVKYYLGDYAHPINEMAIILFVPSVYFIVASTWANSSVLFSNNKKLTAVVLVDMIIGFIVFGGVFVYKQGYLEILQNGLQCVWLGCLILYVQYAIVLASYVARLLKNKKEEDL